MVQKPYTNDELNEIAQSWAIDIEKVIDKQIARQKNSLFKTFTAVITVDTEADRMVINPDVQAVIIQHYTEAGWKNARFSKVDYKVEDPFLTFSIDI